MQADLTESGCSEQPASPRRPASRGTNRQLFASESVGHKSVDDLVRSLRNGTKDREERCSFRIGTGRPTRRPSGHSRPLLCRATRLACYSEKSLYSSSNLYSTISILLQIHDISIADSMSLAYSNLPHPVSWSGFLGGGSRSCRKKPDVLMAPQACSSLCAKGSASSTVWPRRSAGPSPLRVASSKWKSSCRTPARRRLGGPLRGCAGRRLRHCVEGSACFRDPQELRARPPRRPVRPVYTEP